MPSASSSEALCGPPLPILCTQHMAAAARATRPRGKHVGDISEGEVVGRAVGHRGRCSGGAGVCPGADAQTFFYTEVAKEGRIYVFASWSRYDAFIKSNGAEVGKVIEQPGYGPNGETVVFDSEDAINLYNFKHGLPGEQFPKPEEAAPEFPSGKFSGLMFGDYYWYYQWHQDQISGTDPTAVEGQQDCGSGASTSPTTSRTTRSSPLVSGSRRTATGSSPAEILCRIVKDAYLKWTYKGKQRLTLGIHPTLTFDWLDGFWGLRHIEKTPADLYRMDSSRDFGVTFGGPTRSRASTTPHSSATTRAAAPRPTRTRSCASKVATSGIPGSRSRASTGSAGGRRRKPSHGAGRRGVPEDVARAAAQYLWQERESGQPASPIRRSASGPVSASGTSSRRRPTCSSAWTT